MARCEFCKQEMKDLVGCTVTVFDDYPDGLARIRVRYGAETRDWGAKSGRACGDCGCPPNTFHHPGCDVERCPICSDQAFCCGCTYESEEDEEEDCEDEVVGDSVWVPLTRFFGGTDAPEVVAFIYMGKTSNQDRERVWLYKHCDTRKYLMLGESAQTYRPTDDGAVLVPTSRQTALAMVYDGIDEGLALSGPGSMPRFEIFAMQRNRVGA